jgi:hypothetical protein
LATPTPVPQIPFAVGLGQGHGIGQLRAQGAKVNLVVEGPIQTHHGRLFGCTPNEAQCRATDRFVDGWGCAPKLPIVATKAGFIAHVFSLGALRQQ